MVFFGIALLGALLLSFTLTSAVWPTSGCTPHLCPKAPIAEPGQAWGAVTALGTLAAGIGTLVSAIAAVLALRAATAARTATVAPAKRSTVKRPRKRKRALSLVTSPRDAEGVPELRRIRPRSAEPRPRRPHRMLFRLMLDITARRSFTAAPGSLVPRRAGVGLGGITHLLSWSGWPDLNRRPLRPEPRKHSNNVPDEQCMCWSEH